jgi:hypothetical protein
MAKEQKPHTEISYFFTAFYNIYYSTKEYVLERMIRRRLSGISCLNVQHYGNNTAQYDLVNTLFVLISHFCAFECSQNKYPQSVGFSTTQLY